MRVLKGVYPQGLCMVGGREGRGQEAQFLWNCLVCIFNFFIFFLRIIANYLLNDQSKNVGVSNLNRYQRAGFTSVNHQGDASPSNRDD